MKALLDGDMLIYRAAHGAQINNLDLGDGLGAQPFVNEDRAVSEAMRIAARWTEKARCDSCVVVLSAVKSDSFRHRLWPTYKAGRGEKPLAYAAVRKAVEFEFETLQVPGLEADDLLGIEATRNPDQFVIVSGDKDMKTLPAWVLNPMHDDKPVRIRPAVADQMWMKQTMIGDQIDNYPGIPGVGEVAAQKILLNPRRLRKVAEMVGKKNPKPKEKWVEGEECSLWQAMVDRAAKAGMTEDDLVVMAQVARILRHQDWNPETRTVRLWRPGGAYSELTL